ncbi:DUF4124 domain-containing protein [Methyloversatilis sp.]|uniref:DUF4124 domain-containing protein n=1 Tax=Methyloversatilis sp. TaxID=2569862 RepID=UPI003D27ADD2
MKRLVLVAALVASPAFGQVYKCKDGAGKTVFSDQPCGGNAQAIDVRPSRGATPADFQDDNVQRQLKGLEQRQRMRDQENAQLERIREMNRPSRDYEYESKKRRCSDLRARLDAAEALVRNGAAHWQYNDAKARIPALQGQIGREC